jgi:Fe/S biogenesis protein NfuA
MTAEETVLEITDAAIEKALMFRSRDPEPERLALWLEITGVQGGKFAYNMFLDELAKAGPAHFVQHHDGMAVVLGRADLDNLAGARLDRKGDLETGGIYVDNPNSPSPVGGTLPKVGELQGSTEERIRTVLERYINPSIASHGGRADLVSVEGARAVLRLSGGCQGCGMAAVTLREGIEKAIRQTVPDITEIVDVTDHASGTNPYYEPAH